MFGLCSPLPMLPVPWKLKEVAWDDATSTVAHDPEKVPARMQETPFKEDVETILAKGKKKRRPAKLCPVVFAIFFPKDWPDLNFHLQQVAVYGKISKRIQHQCGGFCCLNLGFHLNHLGKGMKLVARVGILSFAIPRTCNFSVLYVLSLPYITCLDRIWKKVRNFLHGCLRKLVFQTSGVSKSWKVTQSLT